MIYGGYNRRELFDDGLIINTDDQSTVRTLRADNFRYEYEYNNCCSTEYQAVIAVAKAGSRYHLVEISATDGSVTVFKEDLQ